MIWLIIMLQNRLIFKNTQYDLSYIINHIWLIIWCILALIHTCYTSSILSCTLKDNFQKLRPWIFCFFSCSCRVKFELFQLCKNVKSSLTLNINVRLKWLDSSPFLLAESYIKRKSFTYKIVNWTKHSITTIYM